MKSISVRLTVWYALTATATLAILFVVGYRLLENHLIHGLDLLNASEFQEVKAHLGSDYRSLGPQVIDRRLRETTEFAAALFYIDIEDPRTGNVFHSTNLSGQRLPDVVGQHLFNGTVPGIGELRIGEYLLPPFDVSIATPLGPVRTVMEGYVEVCVALLFGMLIASVTTGFGLSQIMLRPVRLIRETAKHIGSDNLSERIPVADVEDEISDLARLLNQMFDRLEASFDHIRRFTADASHELKTPLSLVRLHAEKMLIKGTLAAEHKEAVQIQLEELARLNQIIDDLLFLSRADAQAIKLTLTARPPDEFLRNFAQDAGVLADHYAHAFDYTHQGAGNALFEEKWMRQVLLNLLTNAIAASPPSSAISLNSVLSEGIWRISMEDQGCGLTGPQRDRMFDRFVRFDTRSSNGSGNGLGLAICLSIVQLHRGRIYATAGKAERGLSVVIELPANAH